MATDPVCGMFVEERPNSLQLTRDNRTYYFCSSSCRDSYAQPEAERRRLLRRLGVARPLSVAILIFTYLDPSRDTGVLSAALAAIVQGYAGGPFYVGAWDAVRRRIGNMDLLIAVGSSAAFGYSVAALALPGLPPVYYFDASALIVTLILTGNYLEHLARLRAGSALARLGELLPTEVIILRNGAESTVPVGELVPGDTVRVRAGSRMPADGTIRAGRTSVDEAILTGEPDWIPKSPGDPVLAGSVNREGEVSVEVRRVGPETFVAQIGTLLSDAEMARVPLQRTADRIAAWFVPGVLALAIAAGIFWHVVEGTDLTISLLVFVTVTITACPCAFGIATPAALLVGTGRAAEDGILFRGEDAIERVARVDTILTDKTGTLTLPDPALSTWRAIPPFTEGELLATAWGLSRATPHPLSEALRAGAARLGVEPRTIDGAHLDPGRGVRGRIGVEEVAILRGDAAREAGLDLTSLSEWLRSVDERGDSWSVVVRGGRLLGAVAFGSVLVPGARDAVAELRSAGIRVVLVTGDQERPAQRIGSLVGADRVHARADPAAKVALVEQDPTGRGPGGVRRRWGERRAGPGGRRCRVRDRQRNRRGPRGRTGDPCPDAGSRPSRPRSRGPVAPSVEYGET